MPCDAITRAQIREVRSLAVTKQDWLLVATCDIAMYGELDAGEYHDHLSWADLEILVDLAPGDACDVVARALRVELGIEVSC